MLKHFHRPQWQRLMDRGRAVCWWGLAATGLMLYAVHEHCYIDGVGYGGFMSTFGYSLNAMAFALLVLAALSPRSLLYRLRIPGALSLALWSYSIYLSHKAVAHVLHRELGPLGLPAGAAVALITGACVLVGVLLYRAVERPFLQLRDQR